jgi:hypothetical protein
MISALAKFSVFTALAVAAVACASAPEVDAQDDDEAALTRRACGGRSRNICRSNEYCKFTLSAICGRADAQGVCAKKPAACTKEFSGNACMARLAGTSVSSAGACATACTADADCASADVGPNTRLCVVGTVASKACTSGTCGWSCKAPPPSCPAGKKLCPMCGAPPPDGVCRAFSCVAPSAPCPLVP